MAPRQLNDVENAREDILKHFAGDDDDLGSNTELPNDDADDDEVVVASNDDDADDDDLTKSNDSYDDTEEDERTGDKPIAKPATAPVTEEDPRNERFAFQEDREGNFIDKDGKILVKKGRQRDLFVKIKKAYFTEAKEKKEIIQNFQQTVNAARQLLQRYNVLKEEKSVTEKAGLTPAEAIEATNMMAMMKIDPKAAIRTILTKMHLAGTDLKDIGVTGPLDAKEVAAHLLKMQEASKPKPESEEDKASKVVGEFLGRHPTARQHAGALAEAKRRFPHMTYDEIWFQLIDHLRRQNQTPATTAVAQPQRRPNSPIPHNGKRPVSQPGKGKLSLKAVDPSQSFSQIGRDLLRDLRAAERE